VLVAGHGVRAPRWRWPLPGQPEVVRRFDPPDRPYGPGHRGVDLAAGPGTPVLAAGPGVIGYAGVLAGRGVLTVLHAGGLRTTYEPVRPTVTVGTRVAAGAVVGRLAAGHVGCPRAACLHWGLRRGDTYLDPLSLISAGPVRLLPLSGTADGAAPPIGPGPISPMTAALHPALLPPGPATAAGGAALAWAFLATRRRSATPAGPRRSRGPPR
jgi:murein DD-endopeptidase MepM/ murein hydrolase activator NlpD